MDNTLLLWAIVAAVLATFLTRALPFLIFKSQQNHPLIDYLGKFLPPILMVVLVIYAIKTPLVTSLVPFKELLALAIVAITHILFKNSLLSIALGTALYMVLKAYFGT